MIKFISKAVPSTFLTLLVGSTATAEVSEFYSCPNQNTDLGEIVVWDRVTTPEGVRNTPRLKRQNAYITTSQGEFSCQIEWISTYSDEWYLICDNDAHIVQILLEGITVEDKNGSLYKMEPVNSRISATCSENEVAYRIQQTAYQQAFQFDIFIERIYERKVTPNPVGF